MVNSSQTVCRNVNEIHPIPQRSLINILHLYLNSHSPIQTKYNFSSSHNSSLSLGFSNPNPNPNPMASLPSNSSCFQCHDSTSNCFRNGWRLRNGERANLCYRCACVYEDGRFCETFHSNDDGWRDCASCGKLVHCGCVVSFNQYFLLDFGGVICRECSKENIILARNRRYAPEFQTDPANVSVLGNKGQIEPHCWPAGIDSGIQHSPMTPKYVLTLLFEKLLSASDADIRLGRMVIPKKFAETYFPEISEPKGLMMKILDMENKAWEFTFRYWPNNGSRTYVLEGVRDFLVSYKLQAGDTVTFYRVEPGGNLAIGMRKTSVVNPSHQAS